MGVSILLVEDDPNDVLLVQRAARKASFQGSICVVEHGDAAVAYLAGEADFADRGRHPFPDLMLLDLKLPRRSGFEVLSWVRSQPGLRRLPVVVLTSSREGADVDRAYELGANSYLVKPVAYEDLVDLVRHVKEYWTVLNELPRRPAG